MTHLGPEAEQSNQAETAQPATPCPGDEESRRRVSALEAVLFMAAEPLATAELAEILQVTVDEAEAVACRLAAEYEARGLQVTRIAGGYQVSTRPEYAQHVAKLHKPERFRLSRAALETLAIVAYRQPVTRPEVEAIRGVNSDSVLDTLLQYELVCEAGRKDAPGRPVLYRTTEGFLGRFGLDSIDDLPKLDSIPVDEADAKPPRETSPETDRVQEPDAEATPPEPQEQSSE